MLAPVAEPAPLALREARRRWAELLRHIFEVDSLRCPAWGGEMRIVAFISQRAVSDRIPDHLRRARGSARGPPSTQGRARRHAGRQRTWLALGAAFGPPRLNTAAIRATATAPGRRGNRRAEHERRHQDARRPSAPTPCPRRPARPPAGHF